VTTEYSTQFAPQIATQFASDALAFRAGRIARLTAEGGWLTLAGRYPLDRGDNPLPIGNVTLDENGRVTLTVAPDLTVTSNGEPVRETVMRADVDTDLDGGPDRIVHGRLIYELIRRGEIFAVRVRDPDSRRRHEFPGTEWFPPRPEWAVPAMFEPFAQERLISVPYDLGPVLSRSPGQVLLELDGRPWCLDALMDDERKRLFILFGDETNRDLTYGAGRFLYAPLPEPSSTADAGAPVAGPLIVDFNRALNPACAFTEFATCPFPPPQNRLPLRVEAGEKRYREA
jgi:uncharacterized protein (DUF1684 family)